MKVDLKGYTALITGGSSGLGFEMAKEFRKVCGSGECQPEVCRVECFVHQCVKFIEFISQRVYISIDLFCQPLIQLGLVVKALINCIQFFLINT